ncbi:MAG: M12 family metallo-peptidase [Flavipsychrobacter sp.]
MKKLTLFLLLFTVGTYSANAIEMTMWRSVASNNVPAKGERELYPQKSLVYALSVDYMKTQLTTASSFENAVVLQIPNPKGGMMNFKVWEESIMAEELAEKYPEIKNYTAVAVDDPRVTAKINITAFGFDAMVYTGTGNDYVIDPYTKSDDRYYLCYYKSDYAKPAGKEHFCANSDANDGPEDISNARFDLSNGGLPKVALKTNGATKRKYRLALACTGEYANAVTPGTPTKPLVLSAMNTTMARVNGVYQREFGVTMELVANNDQLIFLNSNDGYTNSSGVTMQAENQTKIDNVIGKINYDIGHVFSTGGGGIADLQSVCDFNAKARGVTGQAKPTGDLFDIDYVAHEMGHQFGATHTFNAATGACAGNGTNISAYEPGGGSTIMAYAGICNGNDVANQSDDYFHAKSLDQVSDFITNIVTGGSCATTSAAGNTPPVVASIKKTYDVPYLTPFELEAPLATDADNNGITYCWEEYDLGDFGKSFSDTKQDGPLFRSFKPTASRWRVFPVLDSILNNNLNYLGEKLPEVGRKLEFKLTVRDMFNGTGTFNLSDETVRLHVTTTSGPFLVTAPNQSSDYWQIGSTQTVTWDVAQTTTAPVNCSNVTILLSVDGGYTYPFTLAANTANDGSETITVPTGTNTNTARVKVKADGNVFFDVSNSNFKINNWPADIASVSFSNHITVFPVPATKQLNIVSDTNYSYDYGLFNVVGQRVAEGGFKDFAIIDVSSMASGVYTLRLHSSAGEKISRKVLVQ